MDVVKALGHESAILRRETAECLSESDSAIRADRPLSPGTVIGSYRLLEVLGQGGMGRVYIAEHLKLGRRVAIKMLRGELASSPLAVSRFFAEARAVNRISHDNIVEVTDFIEKAGGDNCYVMELLHGENLGQRLIREGALPTAIALEIAAQIASALAAVHAAGIIHRDLKPDNIFLIDRAGQPNFVKLLDFGVAKLIDPASQEAIALHATAQGQIIGTPEYMSPEQAGGCAIDRRSDIYALGVILYQLVAGALPFRAASFGELVVKLLTVPPVKPSLQPLATYPVPPALDELILDLLAKDPDDRPHSMSDVGVRIHDLLDDMDLPVLPRHAMTSGPMRVARLASGSVRQPTPSAVPAPQSALPPQRRPRWGRAVLAGGALAALGLVGWLAGRAPPAAEVATVPPPAAIAPPPRPPPAAAHVQIHFTSTPAGAEVRLAGTRALLGVTPFTAELLRADRVATFELAKPGFAPVRQELALGADAAVAAALTAELARPPAPPPASRPVRPRPARRAPASPVDRGGTIDVFGNQK